MKIAVFTKKTTFHHGYGGLETQNKILCEGLVQKGHQITVFSPKWELTLDEANEDGVKYVFVDCVYRMGPIFGFFGTWQKENWINRSVEEFSKFNKKGKFELVLAQSSSGLGVIKKKHEYNVKVISISHGSIIGEYKTFTASMKLPRDLLLLIKNTGFTLKNFFRRQRDFVHGSDKVVAVSNFVKESLMEETFVDENKISVVNNGVDPERFVPKDIKLARGKKVLYVGQIIKSKGIQDLVQLFSDPALKDYEIDLLGGGELISIYKNKLSNVNFLGKVTYQELIEKYYKNEEYGLFVLPTKRFEGFPMVLVEAMFSGLPIVAYDMGGVKDAVVEEENGFLIEPGNLEHFKDKVLTVINDDKLRHKMSQRSLQIAYDRFTSQHMINEYEKIIKGVAR